MNYTIFGITLLLLLLTIIYLSVRYDMLKDDSTAIPKPYSYARVQLTWWTFIVLSCLITTIILTGSIPDLDRSTLIVLGIGALTTGSARIIDVSDTNAVNTVNAANAAIKAAGVGALVPAHAPLNRNQAGSDFILDILSDKTGVSIHRLQAVIFNLVFGLHFLYRFVMNTAGLHTGSGANGIIPVISDNNLVLLGLSSTAYLALKAKENKGN